MTTYQVKITHQAKEHLTFIRDYITIQLKSPESAKKAITFISNTYEFPFLYAPENQLYKGITLGRKWNSKNKS